MRIHLKINEKGRNEGIRKKQSRNVGRNWNKWRNEEAMKMGTNETTKKENISKQKEE